MFICLGIFYLLEHFKALNHQHTVSVQRIAKIDITLAIDRYIHIVFFVAQNSASNHQSVMKIKKQFGQCTNNKIIVLIMLTTSQHPVGFFVCVFFLIWSPREIRWQSSGCILSCVKRSIKKIKKEKKLHKNLYTFYLNLQGKYINKQSLGLVYGQLLGGPVFVCES